MARRPQTTADSELGAMPAFPLRNRNLFSNHWLEQRLPLEPEWVERREAAQDALAELQSLWARVGRRVEQYGNEAGLEYGLIQPVFEILGWQISYQAFLDGRSPDYALFASAEDLERAYEAGRASSDFWSHAAVVADAKAWHISLDRPTRVAGRREYPPEQIEWYLNHSLCDFGILTNGRLWRLIPRELGRTKPRFETYLEIDLPLLLDSVAAPEGQLGYLAGPNFDDFFRFFLLFGKDGIVAASGRRRLLSRALEGSSEYSIGVGEQLRDRVFEAQRLAIEGFLAHSPNALDANRDLELCQEQSLLLLYRILFILYGEDRALLPYRINRTYTANRSLARRRDEIAARLDQVLQGVRVVDFTHTSTALWGDLQDLFDLINTGHRTYGVQAYNGGLFDIEANSFLAEKALPDWYLARIIDQLGRAPQPGRPLVELYRVDYRDLAIQQLGSVYEGLLELTPRFAAVDMRVIRSVDGKQEYVRPMAGELPQGFLTTEISYGRGSIYLATDKGERRRTGSYYTPDHIVDHIVKTAIGARCVEIDAALSAEITSLREQINSDRDGSPNSALLEELARLETSYDDRVLELKILDPAMGSGHFLIRACQFLAEDIATNPHTFDPAIDAGGSDEPTIIYWKRKVAENCLHGVDLNKMAVELAKLALWLETVAADAPLTFLDHHLRHGDSVVGARIEQMASLPRDRGLLAGQFGSALAAVLPNLLAPLERIAEIGSTTVDEVHEKENIFRRQFLPIQRRFGAVADLWVTAAAVPRSVNRQSYAELIGALGAPRSFERLQRALPTADNGSGHGLVPFHWELAFPHVFLRPDRPRGFDVIIGNPPYEVISTAETGRDVEPFKKFMAVDPSLAATAVGKNNLYKIFIARSVELLADGGFLSFIVPMAVLGDEQSSGVRRLLFEEGSFQAVHAFPQKDRVSARVFPEAKLSTALFLYRRSSDASLHSGRFVTQAHPAQYIVEDVAPLELDAASVALYDPNNLTILSCSRIDWHLLEELDPNGISRLGELAQFFQGEVNQTNAARAGNLANAEEGQLVIRGASVCLYRVREASQGEDIYLRVERFLAAGGADTKNHHYQYDRLVLQESSPQNNFRRIIAARLSPGEFCNHTINYTTSAHSRIDLALVLFVLNSIFAEWYFRLGSTNAHVSQYQLQMIPCPRFGHGNREHDADCVRNLEAALQAADFDHVEELLLDFAREGIGATVETSIIRLVTFIEAEEDARGPITRTQRARLSPRADRVQIVLDKVLLALIGFDGCYELFRGRLATML